MHYTVSFTLVSFCVFFLSVKLVLVCPSVRLFVPCAFHLSVCLSVCLFVRPSVRLFVACLYVYLFACPSGFHSVHLSVCLSICQFACLSFCLSNCLSVMAMLFSDWLIN